METIKFRGFNKKRNEWIYGFYLQNRGHHFVCPDEFANDKTWEDYEVDPETAEQIFDDKLTNIGIGMQRGAFLCEINE